MKGNLMSIKQIAEYLQMNKMTVYKLAREKKIPAFKVASEWRFKKELIDDWLMNQLKEKPEVKRFSVEINLEAGSKILVVDDDQAIQDYFQRVLKDYSVTKAFNGEDALGIIEKERPDLVLLDIRMPGIDGIETLKEIKKIDVMIPVIMLSAYGTLQDNLEAARLGAYASMAKPFDLNEMHTIIKDVLKKNKSDKDDFSE